MSSPPLKRSHSLEWPHDSFEYTLDIPSEPGLTTMPGALYLIIGVAPRNFQPGASIDRIPIQLREDEIKLPGTRQEGGFEGYTVKAVPLSHGSVPNHNNIQSVFLDLTRQLDLSQVNSINGYSIFTRQMNIVNTVNGPKASYGVPRVTHVQLGKLQNYK